MINFDDLRINEQLWIRRDGPVFAVIYVDADKVRLHRADIDHTVEQSRYAFARHHWMRIPKDRR
jgi:hypothetical protein